MVYCRDNASDSPVGMISDLLRLRDVQSQVE